MTELFNGFGERGVSDETVANRVVDDARFTTCAQSSHVTTNLAGIGRFLPVCSRVETVAGRQAVSIEPFR